MVKTHKNIYKPGGHLRNMEDSKIVKILKSEEIEHTGLEKFAEEVAKKWGVDFKEVFNGMQVGSWMYCYSRKGKNGLYEINYDLLCFAEQEGVEIPVEQAVRTIEENIAKKCFGEDLWFTNGSERIYVMQSPILELKPNIYSLQINGTHFGDYNIEDIKLSLSGLHIL